MAGQAKYRIVTHYVSDYDGHCNYAIQRKVLWWWTTLDTGRNEERAHGRLLCLAGNPLVSGWYDKEGRKTTAGIPQAVPLRNYWLGILAAFLMGCCMVLLGLAILRVYVDSL